MTGLRAALGDLRLEVAALPVRQALPPASRRPTLLALNRILAGRHVSPQPSRDKLEEAWQHLRECRRSGANPSNLPPKILGQAIWLLWEKDRRACEIPGVLEAVQSLASGSTLLLKRFVEAWLRDFAPTDPAMQQVGAWLAGAVMRAPPAAMAVWQGGERRHALFSRPEGPASVAGAVLAGSDPPALPALGFDTPARGAGGYMRAVVRQAAAMLPARLLAPAGEQTLERALTLFVSGDALRFDSEPEMRGMVADALVGAWARGAPPDALRRRVLDIVLTHIGDPRTQPVRWDRAGEETRQIVTGWLAQVTLSAFFGVIGQHAGAAGMGHQWEARRRFWSVCLEKGWVSDAWLVLGSNVRRHVARNRDLLGQFGTLDGSNVNNHSVLLMRIGHTVFAEWSHNGKLYAWPNGSRRAPGFYKPRYTADVLKSAGLDFPPPVHRPDLGPLSGPGLVHIAGVWQGRVAALLRQKDYRLRIEPWEWA